MDDIIRVLVLKNEVILISKIEEITDRELGEPDCLLTDPVCYNGSKEIKDGLSRFPGKGITKDTKMAISSDSILTLVEPDPKLLSEYLIFLSD